ncbi:hypothetical protein PILCRDRAFT_83825 [Piloderma croceum F 1598]|uniref:Uncharacterized protein n=1 Tax=Piloderma croceum (strain F 1598) TaxID=765440 RepID=A0A0C3BYV6_PILCF|nr:hypothetical protein PILCRDRAFT_83825 [Piloderma croceum F 1598]
MATIALTTLFSASEISGLEGYYGASLTGLRKRTSLNAMGRRVLHEDSSRLPQTQITGSLSLKLEDLSKCQHSVMDTAKTGTEREHVTQSLVTVTDHLRGAKWTVFRTTIQPLKFNWFSPETLFFPHSQLENVLFTWSTQDHKHPWALHTLARWSGNAQPISNPYLRKSSVLPCLMHIALYERKRRRHRLCRKQGSFLRGLAIDYGATAPTLELWLVLSKLAGRLHERATIFLGELQCHLM